jgi:hypothetical protein
MSRPGQRYAGHPRGARPDRLDDDRRASLRRSMPGIRIATSPSAIATSAIPVGAAPRLNHPDGNPAQEESEVEG